MTILGTLASGGLAPGAPTIGTATDGGTGTTVSVAFTAPSWVGKGTGTVTYTATSSPGGLTGTATSSPITVSGLTTGTAYTFTVKATTSYGVTGPSSAASNSVTPTSPSSFESIATTIVSGTVSTVTFNSIPSTYRHLELRYTGKLDSADGVADVYLQMNTNTGSIYSNLMNGLYNTTTEKLRQVNTANSSMGYMGGNTSDAPLVSSGIINIPNYTNTSYNKTYYFRTGVDGSGSANMARWAAWGGGVAEITSAINSVTLKCGGITTGTRVDLYGIKG